MNISRLTPFVGTWLYRRTIAAWVTAAVNDGNKNAVRELVTVACSSKDHRCQETAVRGLSSLHHTGAIDYFCEEVVRHNDARLIGIAQECRYVPTGEAQRALFFLGVGEMDCLLALDPRPDHPLLSRGYSMADRGIQEGICTAALANKNSPVLADVLTGNGAERCMTGWTSFECEVIIAGRMHECRWADLWRELFSFPLSQAVRALHALRDAGFVPDGDELTLWQSLLDVLPGTWTFPVPGQQNPGTSEHPKGHPVLLCFSQQSDMLATSGSDGTIRIRDIRRGTLRCSVVSDRGAVRALAISGDQQRLFCISDDMGVQAWEIESGHALWEIPGTPTGPGVFAITPDGNRIFIGEADGKIRSIDTANGEVVVVPYRHGSPITCLTVSPDGRTLAIAGRDNTACLIDPDTGTVCQTFTIPCDTVRSLEITPDNRHLIVIGNHPQPLVYNLLTGKREPMDISSNHRIARWSLSQDGRTFSFFSEDRTLHFLHVPGGLHQSVEISGCDITSCATSEDNATLIAGCSNGRIRFYRIKGGKICRDFLAHNGPVTSLVVSPDGTYLASCSLDGTVKLWNRDTCALVRTESGETGEVTCLSGTLDGSVLFAGSADGTVRIFDQNGNLIMARDMFTTTVLALAVSPDSTVLACAGGDRTLRLWNRNDGSMLGSCEGLKTATRCLAFSPDGLTLVSGGWDGNVRFWQVPDGTLTRTIAGHTSIVTACSVSPDGRVLATGSNDTTIRLWNMADGSHIRTIDQGRTEIGALAMSHDGELLASGEKDGSLRLFCLPEGNSCKTIGGIPGNVTALLFTPDDQALVAGYDSGTLAVYGLHDRRIIHSVPAHTGAITGIVTVPEKDGLVSAGRDGALRVWNLPWTKPLTATTPADISRVASFAQHASSAPEQAQWEFLERLLKCRFNNEIEICTHRPLAGVYDIQIVG